MLFLLIIFNEIFIFSENTTTYNSNTITDSEEDTEKISPFWSFNDSVDLTKYEQFDHQRFIGKLTFLLVIFVILNISIFKNSNV